jgi:hypothetical protein
MAEPYVPYNGTVVTREEARVAGLPRFFSGIPCKHGHLSQRFVESRRCLTSLHPVEFAQREGRLL